MLGWMMLSCGDDCSRVGEEGKMRCRGNRIAPHQSLKSPELLMKVVICIPLLRSNSVVAYMSYLAYLVGNRASASEEINDFFGEGMVAAPEWIAADHARGARP
jgi:hypothetical protein